MNFNQLQIVFAVFFRELLASCVGFQNAKHQAQSLSQRRRETHTPWSRFEGEHTHTVFSEGPERRRPALTDTFSLIKIKGIIAHVETKNCGAH